MRELTVRELNRALLARQLLLERSRLPLSRALERVAGMQAQYAPSTYVRLWSCLERFRREDLTRALERKRAIQGTLMRSTIHVVSRRDYWPLAIAMRGRRSARARVYGFPERAFERAAARIRNVLADGPRRDSELANTLGKETWRPGVGLWVELVRIPRSGTWERRRADLYGLAEDWVGPEPTLSEQDALEHLVRRYLGAFGPAPRTDIADWAGVGIGPIAATLERIQLRRFRDAEGRELLDLPRAPLPDGGTPAPVRFLPAWDATLLVHARRTQILPERFRPLVFNTKTPHSVSTFLVDGAVAGSWRIERSRTAAILVLEPFEPLPRGTRRQLLDEGERLLRFVEPNAGAYRVRT